MKNKMPLIIFIAVFFILSSTVYTIFFHNRITSNFATNIFVGVSNIITITDENDIAELKKILKGRAFKNSPACGFSNEISITMEDEKKSIKFCPALDGDPIIRINASDRYIYISKKQRKQLDEILGKYGFVFPHI